MGPCEAPEGTNTKVTSAKGHFCAYPTTALQNGRRAAPRHVHSQHDGNLEPFKCNAECFRPEAVTLANARFMCLIMITMMMLIVLLTFDTNT